MIWAVSVVALLLAGCALLAAEILVIPGFGLVGILGIGSFAAAGVVAMTQLGTVYGVLAFAAGGLGAIALVWLLPRTRTGKAMVLTTELGRARGPRADAEPGQTGRAVTSLRPAGTVDIDGRSVDVVTDGIFVDEGTPVRVVRVEGARVVVEPVSKEEIRA